MSRRSLVSSNLVPNFVSFSEKDKKDKKDNYSDDAIDILKKIFNLEDLTWWGLAVLALSSDSGLEEEDAASRLAECWPTSTNITKGKEEDILRQVLNMPRKDLTWQNIAILSYAREHNADLSTSISTLNKCWPTRFYQDFGDYDLQYDENDYENYDENYDESYDNFYYYDDYI